MQQISASSYLNSFTNFAIRLPKLKACQLVLFTEYLYCSLSVDYMSESESDSSISSLFKSLSVREPPVAMDEATLQNIITNAISHALQGQHQIIQECMNELSQRIERSAPIQPRAVVEEVFAEAEINREIRCEDTLDAVKSLPEFFGNKKNEYLSFRRAVHVAYKVFEPFVGSVKHYQALTIIRNKIRGSACDKLTGHNTPLNFKAIIARLDHEYGDKRPLHLLEQEMSTLRQGNLSVADYYEQVQLKLSALTNKTLLSYEPSFAAQLNDKFRKDALRVFVSGLKKSISDTLFSSRPEDLPAALALAEELEGNRERYQFAANYNGDYNRDSFPRKPSSGNLSQPNSAPQNFNSQIKPNSVVQRAPNPQVSLRQFSTAEPMDIDPSLRTRRSNLSRQQNLNHLENEQEDLAYEIAVENAFNNENEGEDDIIHFLEDGPCSPSS